MEDLCSAIVCTTRLLVHALSMTGNIVNMSKETIERLMIKKVEMLKIILNLLLIVEIF